MEFRFQHPTSSLLIALLGAVNLDIALRIFMQIISGSSKLPNKWVGYVVVGLFSTIALEFFKLAKDISEN